MQFARRVLRPSGPHPRAEGAVGKDRKLCRRIEAIEVGIRLGFGEAETLRTDTLFDVDGAAAAPDAAQLYLLALTGLEQAHRYFVLAGLAQSRALAGR